MTGAGTAQGQVLTLWDGPAGLHLVLPADGPAALVGGDRGEEGDAALVERAVQPLVEVLAVGHGRRSTNVRHTATSIGARLRGATCAQVDTDAGREVTVVQEDPVTGLWVDVVLQVEASALRARTVLHHDGSAPLVLQAVSSLALSAPLGRRGADGASTVEGHSEWLGESRWTRTDLAGNDALVDLDLPAHQHQDGRSSRSIVSTGAWSSGSRIPAGVLEAHGGGPAVAWQVEHNGAWRVEVGDRLSAGGVPVLAAVLLGPTDGDHSWHRRLEPGGLFETVPVSLAWSPDGWQGAVAVMTDHRRGLRSGPSTGGWVVFNDYMNTLMGDPTTGKLLPLIDAAGAAGAEVFCIDAGWYDDSGDWWDSVGRWEPSTVRFPGGGLEAVVERIRAAGMVPGLWLEPEVVGVRSTLAQELPDEAFLQRSGQRIVEQERHLLDLRHDAARKHLDAVVDRLVDDFGVGYFKLDYNVTPGPGTDLDADSVGDGLLEHNRAHLAWLEGVRERHPSLLLENCASGGMRSDFAMMRRSDLQSTSDQQNPLLYPPIAVGAPLSILPEQAASWAYPQPTMTDEEIVFTLCTGLAGRFYLSGHLDAMTPRQLALVREAVQLAQRGRDALHRSAPTWPLGLPAWDDTWVAGGLQGPEDHLVTAWFRGGPDQEVVLRVPDGEVAVAFPDPGDDAADLSPWALTRNDDGSLTIRTSSAVPQARVLRITPRTSA